MHFSIHCTLLHIIGLRETPLLSTLDVEKMQDENSQKKPNVFLWLIAVKTELPKLYNFL